MFLAALVFTTITVTPVYVCEPVPLPTVQERTEEFWKGYLNSTLQACFGYLGDGVKNAIVQSGDIPYAEVKCNPECLITISRKMLSEAGSAGEIVFVLGHEATHVVFGHPTTRNTLGPLDHEFLGDLVGSRAVKDGACYAVRVMKWIHDNIPPSEQAESFLLGKEVLVYRRSAMLANCAANLL